MLKLYIDKDKKTLEIPVTGIQTLWSIKRSFSIPLDHVSLPIVIRPVQARESFKGWKMGTHIPGGFTAGTYWSWDLATKSFYYLSDPERCIMINTTNNENFDFIILEVEEGKTPDEVAAEITKAVEHSKKLD